MKVKWKIIISVLTIFFVLLFMSTFLLFTGSLDSPDGSPIPINSNANTNNPNNRFPLSRVDKLLDEMEFGAIAFNAPTNININDAPQIQLVLSLAETVEKLKQSISEKGEKLGMTIRVSERMEAGLSGYMFIITAITSEIQAVSKSQRTEWKWEIHPKEEGRHKLHLTLTALLEIDGDSIPRTIRTFDKVIEVNVTNTQKIELFFNNNWQWLWAAVLIPIIGWFWGLKKSRDNKGIITK